MKDNKADKKDLFSNISQEIKEIPIIKEYIEKYHCDNTIRYPEDFLLAIALDLVEFWELDKSSQNTLIKKIIIRMLKLESEL